MSLRRRIHGDQNDLMCVLAASGAHEIKSDASEASVLSRDSFEQTDESAELIEASVDLDVVQSSSNSQRRSNGSDDRRHLNSGADEDEEQLTRRSELAMAFEAMARSRRRGSRAYDDFCEEPLALGISTDALSTATWLCSQDPSRSQELLTERSIELIRESLDYGEMPLLLGLAKELNLDAELVKQTLRGLIQGDAFHFLESFKQDEDSHAECASMSIERDGDGLRSHANADGQDDVQYDECECNHVNNDIQQVAVIERGSNEQVDVIDSDIDCLNLHRRGRMDVSPGSNQPMDPGADDDSLVELTKSNHQSGEQDDLWIYAATVLQEATANTSPARYRDMDKNHPLRQLRQLVGMRHCLDQSKRQLRITEAAMLLETNFFLHKLRQIEHILYEPNNLGTKLRARLRHILYAETDQFALQDKC